MKNKIFPLIVMTLSILSASCTKEVKYTKEELFARTKAADPTAALVLPKDLKGSVSCGEYSEGCMSTHIVRVKDLELIAVEFSSTEQAIYAAKKYRGYYVRNWFLDDVAGEPVLEKFVTENLEAKKP